MIIKEFRIIIPMTVEEYQIGQLYTIQKKSRIESVGAGSGVEIIENKPFEMNNEKGQYTLKVYHVDERLPSSLKTVTKLLFPKSALLFEEESWNCYPYTRTKYRHKLFKSFNIDIESKYLSDWGQSENTFNLNKAELAIRNVDYIDIVNDPVNPHEYKPEEDPSLFVPVRNKERGPLTKKWIANLKAMARSSSRKTAYMCCYKLCRIECAFWGCQSRVEKSIADSVLRNMLLITHRQAWVWQDEYVNLTITDVRKLEAETQRYLTMKMNGEPDSVEIEHKKNENKSSDNQNSSANTLEIERLEINNPAETDIPAEGMKKPDSEYSMKSCASSHHDLNRPKRHSQNELEFNLQLLDDNNEDFEDMLSQNSNNIDEFYDAISQASVNPTAETKRSIEELKRKKLVKLSSITDSESSMEFNLDTNLKSNRYSSIKSIHSDSNNSESQTKNVLKPQDSQCSDSSATSSKQNLCDAEKVIRKVSTKESLRATRIGSQAKSIDTLILVVHGGNVTCTDTSKKSDFANFKATMESVVSHDYKDFNDHLAYRLVTCEPVCKEALLKLACCSPVACNEIPSVTHNSMWQNNLAETSAEVFSLHENLPFSTIPLLISANSARYQESVAQLTRDCNRVYQEFLSSHPGFQGRVVVVGDSIGALLVYDALSNQSLTNINNSDNLSTASSISNLNGAIKQSNINATTHITNSASPSPVLSRKMTDTNPQINISISNLSEPLEITQRLASNSDLDNSALTAIESPSTTSYLTPIKASTTPRSISVDEKLDFDVSHFFVFGSPLGLVLTYRKLAHKTLEAPLCTQMYNLFHLTDPGAVRVEPLLCKQFSYIQPCMIPRYSKFPLGDGHNLSLDHFIVKHGNLFDLNNIESNSFKRESSVENYQLTPDYDQLKSLHKIIQTKKNWWGDNRLDYVLYAPEKIAHLPKKSLPYLFHSCFWESTDVSAFILRMLQPHDVFEMSSNQMTSSIGNSLTSKKDLEPAPGQLEIQNWKRKFNRVKLLKNLSPNHRSNDVIVNEDKEQVLSAKFSYGPLDLAALSGEKIDIYIMKDVAAAPGKQKQTNKTSEWVFLANAVTDNHGKVSYTIPENKRLPHGIYQIKMIVVCDHSYVEFYMAVLPDNTQAVVYSIDGSFAANISFTGTDPKVRAGAVDVVRHWQDLGYLIIYVTARPDIQHYKVTNWLGQHNFPLGMVFFSNGLRHDPIKQKTETLRNLVVNNGLKLQAAYGSPKDIPMYSSLGVLPSRIFIIAKALKSKHLNSAVLLKDGYASHLASLKSPNADSRQAEGNARLFLRRTTFSIKQTPMFSGSTNGELPSLESQISNGSSISSYAANSPHSIQSHTYSAKSSLSSSGGGPVSPKAARQNSTANILVNDNQQSLNKSKRNLSYK